MRQRYTNFISDCNIITKIYQLTRCKFGYIEILTYHRPNTGRIVTEIKKIKGTVKNFSQKCVIIKILHLYLQCDFNINTLTK